MKWHFNTFWHDWWVSIYCPCNLILALKTKENNQISKKDNFGIQNLFFNIYHSPKSIKTPKYVFSQKCILSHKKSSLTVEWTAGLWWRYEMRETSTFGLAVCPFVMWWKSPVRGEQEVSAVSLLELFSVRFSSLLVLAECSLLLCVLDYLLLHVEAFAAADSVHVFQGLVCRVGFLPEVQVFFFCGGNPAWVAADHLGHREEHRHGNGMVIDSMRQHSTYWDSASGHTLKATPTGGENNSPLFIDFYCVKGSTSSIPSASKHKFL